MEKLILALYKSLVRRKILMPINSIDIVADNKTVGATIESDGAIKLSNVNVGEKININAIVFHYNINNNDVTEKIDVRYSRVVIKSLEFYPRFECDIKYSANANIIACKSFIDCVFLSLLQMGLVSVKYISISISEDRIWLLPGAKILLYANGNTLEILSNVKKITEVIIDSGDY